MKTAPQRFDDSFVIRTIRDFFVGLLVIFVIELGARYALVLWNYETVAKQETRRAAENLAGDLRAIMLNRGGPVAARTVYPILERDHERLGYEIAIEPSADTVKAVAGMMDGKPRGIPPDWSEGAHHEARVAVRAEKFCTACHTRSEPGDTLGWVTVRDYRDSHVALWWAGCAPVGAFRHGQRDHRHDHPVRAAAPEDGADPEPAFGGFAAGQGGVGSQPPRAGAVERRVRAARP